MPQTDICLDIPPLMSLLEVSSAMASQDGFQQGCVLPADSPQVAVAEWIRSFVVLDNNTLASAFTRVAYLVTKSMFDTTYNSPGNLLVNIDPGIVYTIPAISLGGVIAISVLVGLYLIPFISLAIYEAIFPRWTRMLDS
jgi:hypothetical protein